MNDRKKFGVSMRRGIVAGGLLLVVQAGIWRLHGVENSEWRDHGYEITDDASLEAAWQSTADMINFGMRAEQFVELFGAYDEEYAIRTVQNHFYDALSGRAMGLKHEMFSSFLAAMAVLKRDLSSKDARVKLRIFRATLGLCPDNAHVIEQCDSIGCYPGRVVEYLQGRGIWSDTTMKNIEHESLVHKHFGIPSSKEFFVHGMPMNICDAYLGLRYDR